MEKGQLIDEQSLFVLGISDYDKYGQKGSYAFGRSIDHRTNVRELTLLPKTSKESGSVVTDLVKCGERVEDTTYLYGNSGNFYSRTLDGTYTKDRRVSDSSGNGLAYYGEDGFVYYTGDRVIGRYGTLFSDSPTFADNFLGSEGGNPTNTNSLDLESGSSQYATAADSASLSQTGDLTIEAYIKPESLPAVGELAALVSKWDESGSTKSYRMGIYGVSGVFGDGSEGALTISSNTTDSPIDASCSGTSGTYTLSATNASFAVGQKILIHQTRGTNAGTYQKTEISGYTAGTITTADQLSISYSSTGSNKAQVIVQKQYTNVTVNSGVTWTAKAWNGTVGGVLTFLCNGTLTVNGTISASGRGFLGASAASAGNNGRQGEGTSGARNGVSTSANGNGGGGGTYQYDSPGDGGGGGHASSGSNGWANSGTGGTGGSSAGSSDLTTMVFGGGGGSGGAWHSGSSGTGGNGGGIIYPIAASMTVNNTTGYIKNDGAAGGAAADPTRRGSGGGGGSGSTRIEVQTATLNTLRVLSIGGLGNTQATSHGGDGSNGRNHISYYTSYSGTTTPTINADQDDSLVTNTTYQLRLSVSDDGSTVENLGRTVDISTGSWWHLAVVFDASESSAEMFLDGVSQGTSTGTMTSIDDNASLLYLAANKGASVVENFFDGLIDEVRIRSEVRTEAQIAANKDVEESSLTANLEAYYEVDETVDDSSANSNTLTLQNAPSYSTDVPFSAPTTRLDLDQSLDTSGNTYTLATSIDEGNTHRQTFVPAKDPQKSIEVLIAAKGTGDWTLTVHDPLNKVVASQTVVNASLPTSGDYEFVFDDVWTPILGASYHFHITSTVADGTITTTDASDMETADFHTYYQFLVTDTDFHPITQMINFLAIGNGRYVAKYAADSGYEPHRLTLPPGWTVRAFAKWRHYLAIGCWRGGNVKNYDEGIIFFWDGISETYNDYLPVKEGAINAMYSAEGMLSFVAGYQGDLLEYVGGTKAKKVKTLPKMDIGSTVDIMPGALSMWQTALRIGVSGTNTSTAVERGVYTWDNKNEDYPKAMSYDYPISTGTRTSTNVEIGLILPVDGKMLVSWKDNTSYGVDVVDPAGDPFLTGTIERLIEDYGAVWKEKNTVAVGAVFKPLLSGESITIKYKLDRGDWVSVTESTAGETTLKLPISKGRHREVQIAADLATSTTTSPTLLELSLFEDTLATEERYLLK